MTRYEFFRDVKINEDGSVAVVFITRGEEIDNNINGENQQEVTESTPNSTRGRTTEINSQKDFFDNITLDEDGRLIVIQADL
jgi:hypothetical protein